MTVEEVFSQFAEHMIEGLMTHSQLSDYFGFIGLDGYQECHKYHYFEENCNYKDLCDYYIHHFNKLIKEKPFKNPNLIPASWYQYNRKDVDANTRKSAIQTAFEKWVDWEKKTKSLYEMLYQELINLNEISAAKKVCQYIEDVDYELAEACQKHLELVSIGYNISDIVLEQEEIKKKYAGARS